ncbi:peptidase S8/S53 domain-containing protein [Powellomyces hirtus]|nr:peptidase S8/S53 domain-containing protein [Powellomyces hirtus]
MRGICHFLLLFLFAISLCWMSIADAAATRRIGRQWAVQLHDPVTSKLYTPEQAEEYAKQRGFLSLGQIGALQGYFLFEAVDCSAEELSDPARAALCQQQALKRRSPEEVHSDLLESEHVRWFEQQMPKQRSKRQLDFKLFPDPLFPRQWHLHNDGVNGKFPSHDINVTPVWARGINGSGTTVSVIDDGVLFTHPDLTDSWYEAGSYDFNERTTSPLPQSELDNHGTRCAGEIAAAVNNVCGVGVAFGVRLAAERLIGDKVTDGTEAQALNYRLHDIDIYSSSWGPDDDGKSLDGPGYLATAALEAGVMTGRNGHGNIFVFASGNGGQEGDNCNFDSFANSIHTVSIGAITNAGDMPSYGEHCSAHLAVTYSGGNGLGIVTTDIGQDAQCTDTHSGTSAAAPLASGIIALMLSARPDLGWRDVQHLIVTTAKKNDANDGDWRTNGAGHHVSHKYGFGAMDANLLVEASEKHTPLPSPPIQVRKSSNGALKIHAKPQPAEGAVSTMLISEEEAGGLLSVEHVQVTVRIRHPDRKYLRIKLISPSNTESIIAAPRVKDDSRSGFNPWTFMTVHSWGEKAVGTWTLIINDVRSGETDPFTNEPFSSGELLSWSLAIHGTCGEEDVVIDPTQVQAGGRTCSHTVAHVHQQRRQVVGMVLIMAALVLLICAFIFWRRTRGVRAGGHDWTKLPENASGDNTHGDIESPSKGTIDYDRLKSPVDIESPRPEPSSTFSYKFPTSSSSGVKRSASIELLAVRPARNESPLSPQVALDMTNDDSDSETENHNRPSSADSAKRAARRIEAVRNDYLHRSNSRSPLTKTVTTSTITAPTLSSPPIGSPASLRRAMSKTPPPNLTGSPKPLSRSPSTSSLLKRSASAEMLKKFTD